MALRLLAVFVVHGTKKFLDRVGKPNASEGDFATTALGPWYATVLFWRPQVAFFVNERTRLPLLMPLAPAVTVVERFPAALVELLVELNVARPFIERELAEMGEHRLAKTNSRSVLGTMNDFTYLAEAHLAADPGADLIAVSKELADTPVGPLRASHGFPDLELAALVAEVMGQRRSNGDQRRR